jgi:glycosyltransferase involved in cell wall biosynthesis
MARLKILTFNWHEAYLCLLAKTGHDFVVVDKIKGGYRGWLHGTRPVPKNLTLLPVGSEQEAASRARQGEFDLIVCHNVSDLIAMTGIPTPKIMVFHNRILTEMTLSREAGQAVPPNDVYIAQLRSIMDERTRVVFISRLKQADLAGENGIAGKVILPGIDLDEYGGYHGDTPCILRVGNFFAGRNIMMGQSIAAAATNDLAVTVLGINPEIPGSRLSTSWEDLKQHFRSHRVYLNTTAHPYEDGYNLSMLEAMATGMPVVSLQNPTCPIENDRNGFVAGNPDALRESLLRLLNDPDLARRLGAKARETVEALFPLGRFVDEWNKTFEASMQDSPAGAPGGFDYFRARRLESAVRCRREADEKEQAGEPSAALEIWREAVALDPDHVAARYAEARLLRRLGLREDSERKLAQIRERFPLATDYHRWHPAIFGLSGAACADESVDSVLPLLRPPASRKKILFSYCSNPQTTAVYLERAFRKRHDVLTWGPAISPETLERWDLNAIKPFIVPTDLGYDTPSPPEALRRRQPGWKPDLFLWVESGVEFVIEDLDKLECLTACYLIDTHIESPGNRRIDRHLELAKRFDVVFLAQRAYVPRFLEAGMNAHWLPLGCDPEVHADQRLPRIYPVGFVGSLTDKRRKDLLDRLAAVIPVHRERCFLRDMARVFSQSKIVFNNAIHYDLNMRVFEAMAAGALLLTDPADGSGLEDFFKNGVHCAIYRKDEEVGETARRWLADEEARARVAKRGQEEALARHTYEHRAVVIEKMTFESGAAKRPPVAPERILSRDEVRTQARSLLTTRSAGVAGDPEIEAKFGRARILLSAGKLEEAREWLNGWKAEGTQAAYKRLGLGCLALSDGSWEDAERHFRAALQIFPDEPRALAGLGIALSCLGRDAESTAALKRSFTLGPAGASLLSVLLRASRGSGLHADGLQALTSALNFEPSNPDLFFSCAALSARMGNHNEALKFLERLEAIRPAYPNLDRWRKEWEALAGARE